MHCLGQQILAFCNRKACRPFVTCHSSQVLTVQELVSVGHGVSLLPAMACALDRHPRRRYRRLSGEAPTRTLGLVWHKQRFQRPIVRRFIEFVQASVARNQKGRNVRSPVSGSRPVMDKGRV